MKSACNSFHRLAVQPDLFDPLPCQEFEVWKGQPGAGHVLRECYRVTAGYAGESLRSGIPVSVKLVWELVRHRLKRVRGRASRLGVDLDRWGGYRLNNRFTASVARHILAHRPEWAGVFELREEWAGEARSKRDRVIVIPAHREV